MATGLVATFPMVTNLSGTFPVVTFPVVTFPVTTFPVAKGPVAPLYGHNCVKDIAFHLLLSVEFRLPIVINEIRVRLNAHILWFNLINKLLSLKYLIDYFEVSD